MCLSLDVESEELSQELIAAMRMVDCWIRECETTTSRQVDRTTVTARHC